MATRAFQDPTFFHQLFQGHVGFHKLDRELPKFKMGLFGSIKPTSDIDVGLQYNGRKLSEMNYMVNCLEEMFLLYTKRSSLDFDIEIYADLLTIYEKPMDRFYLNSSNFGAPELKRLLPYAFNSILRNLLLREEKDGTKITFADFFKKLKQEETVTVHFCKLLSITKQEFYGSMRKYFNDSKKELHTFLTIPYDRQRSIYYEKVKRAEHYRQTHYDVLAKGNDMNVTVEMMCLMAEALTYRMESYLCAPTIIHIVRVLQANKNIDYKRKTADIYCKVKPIHEDPFCSIGLVGFILSVLEQIGYLLRFQGFPEKIKKYSLRLDDAIHHINQIYNHRSL